RDLFRGFARVYDCSGTPRLLAEVECAASHAAPGFSADGSRAYVKSYGYGLESILLTPASPVHSWPATSVIFSPFLHPPRRNRASWFSTRQPHSSSPTLTTTNGSVASRTRSTGIIRSWSHPTACFSLRMAIPT